MEFKKILLIFWVSELTLLSVNYLGAESLAVIHHKPSEAHAIDDLNEQLNRQTNCTQSKSGKFKPIDSIEKSGYPAPEDGEIRILSDEVEGQGRKKIVIKGTERNAIFEYQDQIFNADKIIYENHQIKIDTNFKLKNGNNLLTGKNLEYDVKKNLGRANVFRFNSVGSKFQLQGEGESLEILRKNFYQLKDARINTCHPNDDSWYLKAKEINVDFDKNIGVAKNTQLILHGIPIIMVPWFDFPINGHRKSGFLSPIGGIKSGNGLEIGLPYYLNLAPNDDMTITPHIYSKRGIGLDGEFRYLFSNYHGQVTASFLPSDRVAKKDLDIKKSKRYALSFQHFQNLTPHLFLGIDYHQVSDNNYFKDFGSRTASAENNNLNRQIWLTYQNYFWGGPFSVFLTYQNYQTLQNSAGTINEPYRLQPQLTLKWSKLTQGKTEIDILAQVTNFDHRLKQTGVRSLFYPRVTWNFSNEYFFLRPRIGLHATHYQLDNFWSVDKNGNKIILPRRNFTRVLPIFSVDSGLVMERSFQFRKKNFIQTLEPRLFYTYIPKKKQNNLPNFDSERTDVTFSSLFRVNRFTGYDRVNSANNLSYSLVSKFYHQDNGEEIFRAGFGQRIYFQEDDVGLNNKVGGKRNKRPDTLLFAQGKITDRILLQTDLFLNGKQKNDNRYVLGLRYFPEEGKVLNLRYKYDKNSPWLGKNNPKFEEVDFSFQWPINRQYSLLGRYNYSLSDRKLLESLIGIEYLSECQCWGVNAVFQTYVTEYNKRKNAVFFQLKLKGLGGLGVSPFHELYRSIPGYSYKREVR